MADRQPRRGVRQTAGSAGSMLHAFHRPTTTVVPSLTLPACSTVATDTRARSCARCSTFQREAALLFEQLGARLAHKIMKTDTRRNP